VSIVISSLEIKKFIIETLGLEDLSPEDIGDEEPLFAGGLGLDSIDALELGIALRKKYQVEASGEDPGTRDHFRTVNSLLAFVAQHGQAPGA
jgi:acyl carrier protein